MKVTDFNSFIDYCEKHIKGDEKGEAQLFLDHFFNALGYTDGLKGAGANCEFRIKDEQKGSTQFADLVWKSVVLIEMKKRDTDLSLHYQQAFEYWTRLVPDRPKYVILCNFDEFWIYDLNVRVYEPLEKVALNQLTERNEAFSFLLPKPRNPIFYYNKEDVTEKAAWYISHVYINMTKRGISSEVALSYCLQVVLCMFAEDVELLPDHIFTRIIRELLTDPVDEKDKVTRSYDLISGLFKAMNTEGITPGGMYKDVDYFNGGLFDTIYSIELTKQELELINLSASFNWRNVNPAIFGSIFESALTGKERHKLGAHYTHEIDIKKIVVPVIVQPWTEKIDNAESLSEYYALLEELAGFKVLDPACGSGNFLFIAYKEMKLIEKRLLRLVREHSVKLDDAKRLVHFLTDYKFVTTSQFYGLDIKPFAVELAKVTLMIAKELTWLETKEDHDNKYKPLPLDNLDNNIICTDALLNEDSTQKVWPEADVIIGNPPYQSKNKMQKEFGVEYMNKLRNAYPEIPGRADFCVYWFYKAHLALKNGCYAGLVGTSSIRQKNSREGSLDFISNNGGEIFNAISMQSWSGEAAVSVSIINWKKGYYESVKYLFYTTDNKKFSLFELTKINSDLKPITDLSTTKILPINKDTKLIYLGQTQGHDGFLIKKQRGKDLLDKNPEYAEVLKPFLIGNNLISNYLSQPERFVIDFTFKDIIQATKYTQLFSIIEKLVLPERQAKAKKQIEENDLLLSKNSNAQINSHHINFFNNWWKLSYGRPELIRKLANFNRYICCSQISLRPIFEFVSSQINPSSTLVVFLLEDNYSFGILQSSFHFDWWKYRGSSFEARFVYITSTIWDTFPWPQNPTVEQIEKVAKAALELRTARNSYMQNNHLSLRDLYRTLEKPGKNPIKDLHEALDKAVTEAYGFDPGKDLLQQLLDLNLLVYDKEQKGKDVQGPGIPKIYTDKEKLITEDCVRFEI